MVYITDTSVHFLLEAPCSGSDNSLPAMWETWVWSLGRENPLEKEIATHSSILAWRIWWTEEPDGLQFTGLQRVRHDQESNTFTFQAKLAQTHLARIILMCEIADIIKLSIDYQRKRKKVGQGTFVLLNLQIDVTEESNGQDVQCHLSMELRDGKSVKVMVEDASLVSGCWRWSTL